VHDAEAEAPDGEGKGAALGEVELAEVEVDDERRKQGVAQGGGGEAGDGTARACSARKESRVAAHTGRRERAAAVVVASRGRVARSLGTRGSEQRAGHRARSGWGENERVRWEDLAAKKIGGGIFTQMGPAAGVRE
jgi:hypothetical protein